MWFVAALLLVALGVGLGAGPLQGDSEKAARDAAAQRDAISERDSRIDALTDVDELAAAYTSATAARVVAGRLTGRKVAVVTLPGSSAETTAQIETLLRSAGAQVTARVQLADALLEPESEGLVEALSSQMLQQTSGVVAPAGANGYQRVGALLARAAGVPASAGVTGAAYDPPAVSVVSGLVAAKLVGEVEVGTRAALAVVVLPPATSSAAATALAGVVAGFASQVSSVVAGPAATAGDGQVLALLRSQGVAASTADSLETPMARVVAVLALAARTRGVTGDYGVVGAVNGPVPPVS